VSAAAMDMQVDEAGGQVLALGIEYLGVRNFEIRPSTTSTVPFRTMRCGVSRVPFMILMGFDMPWGY
jgi:hypothetical protein